MIVLKAPQEQVLAALQSVAGIVERRHTLPMPLWIRLPLFKFCPQAWAQGLIARIFSPVIL